MGVRTRTHTALAGKAHTVTWLELGASEVSFGEFYAQLPHGLGV